MQRETKNVGVPDPGRREHELMSADRDTADTTHESSAADSSVPESTVAESPAAESPVLESAAAESPAAGRFERVLVVTRDDDAGRAAVETGIDLAAAQGAAVDALYVVDDTEGWDVVVERRERTGERLVEDAAERGADAGVDVEKRFRYGTPYEQVLDFADAHDADLIVVGSARRTGLDRLVHPEPVPVRVQRGASAPVMVVGPDDA
ncbi:universal stress protein [Halorubrum sp. CSM-61]|uniref:universal stress protein n=1 Tax=Halorubrum sp. CSM-61 TaxID=2485838 RepID=UPI001F15464B|nr:universal stress protein [Halorubrum sp. CSM-61]